MIWKKGRKCIYVCLIYYLFTWKSDKKNKTKNFFYSKQAGLILYYVLQLLHILIVIEVRKSENFFHYKTLFYCKCFIKYKLQNYIVIYFVSMSTEYLVKKNILLFGFLCEFVVFLQHFKSRKCVTRVLSPKVCLRSMSHNTKNYRKGA